MAYSYTITRTKNVIGKLVYHHIKVEEADAAAASEWSVDNLPSIGEIVHFQATLATATSTGTTIQPKLGKATGWTADTQDDIGQQDAAAAHINDTSPLPYTMAGTTLYGCSVVDAGTDNDIETLIVIREGVL